MIRKFYDNGIEGSGFGGDPLNPFEGAKKEDFGKPIVDDKKEPVVDEKKEPIVDDKKELVVDKKEPEVKQPALHFDEELKKTDKWETLKKLGFDDFEIGLLKYKAETGDLAPYLEVKT